MHFVTFLYEKCHSVVCCDTHSLTHSLTHPCNFMSAIVCLFCMVIFNQQIGLGYLAYFDPLSYARKDNDIDI